MDWTRYDAALFDLDGVLTPTADVHMRAWERMFTDYLAARADAAGEAEDAAEAPRPAPYVESDYFDYIDGKPRYDGVRAFLASRHITLPEGTPEDAPGLETVCGLGNRKNDVFNEVLAAEGVTPYPGSLALLDALGAEGADGVQMAVVSSSKNAPAVLAAAGIADRFEVVVDGAVAASQGLPGKPAPDTFWRAAQALGVPRERCVVLEDAHSGVQAGAAGGFGLVVGVDRGAGADALRASGADLVVDDLAELLP